MSGGARQVLRQAWRIVCAAMALSPGAVSAAEHPAPAPGKEPVLMRSSRPPAKPVPARLPIQQALVRFKSAPFPYAGEDPGTGKPFLDTLIDERAGRQSARINGVYWADETYSDDRVLLAVPQRFRASQPGAIVVFLHGNAATLERDVVRRQQVPRQIAASGLNAVLVAPQLAFDAWDSSAGAFWQPGAFAAFLEEASHELARLIGKTQARKAFDAMPVILVAYSGGYLPLAYILHHGGAGKRIAGVVVLDGVYGEVDKFARWMEGGSGAFLVSAYTASSQDKNLELARRLGGDGIETRMGLGADLPRATATFIETGAETSHADFVTRAWVDDPLADILRRIELPRRPSKR